MRLLNFLKNPTIAAALAGITGIVFGLVVLGWGLLPVEWKDASPDILAENYRVEYMRMTIDSFGLNHDADLALARWDTLGNNAASAYKIVFNNPGKQNPGDVFAFAALIESKRGSIAAMLEANGQAIATPDTGGAPTSNPNIKWILIGAALLVLGAVAFFVVRPLIFGKKLTPEDFSPARQAQELNRAVEKTDFGKMGLQDPITRTMTTYVLGDDLYDESFSIDSAAGEFLGEYGVGISEAVGVGEPKKVTAIEIWLFDKNDIKTATKVLMSPHAFSDVNIRGRLEAKGELVQLQPQAQIILETATLQLLATVVDLEYGSGAMPQDSYFERITLELAIWPK